MTQTPTIYFSDFFDVDRMKLERYGALDISLISDLPLFLDPFLLFGSQKEEYKLLHSEIIKYIIFLRDKAKSGQLTPGLVSAWFTFPEEKGNWFGYSETGNRGHGLGAKFANALTNSLEKVFVNFGEEKITESGHFEKLGLIKSGVGRDNISDLTTNLIKKFLLKYTEKFAKDNISPEFLQDIAVDKVYFDYDCERWMGKIYTLPIYAGEYLILTPKDMLTKDEIWINRNDLSSRFKTIINSIPDTSLRDQLNNYLAKALSSQDAKFRREQERRAIDEIIESHPEILDYYLKDREENKDDAKSFSESKVDFVKRLFIDNVIEMVTYLREKTEFYDLEADSYDAAYKRVIYLKDFIEKHDGWRLFYDGQEPIGSEANLQLIYRLTWYATGFDVNREVNNGRGPVDYAVSKGRANKSLVEFKLASNSKLEQNLANQVKVYEEANGTKKSMKAIMYYKESELERLIKIINRLDLQDDKSIVIIDATPKQSASNVK
ncbi:hypothetical protein [Deinococcus frigens]|uniref:hypothetical protein n=1 Tax=Deinococcus frigens TaxID=249403 RepID=UPI000A06A78E|nr:hypothetical protein [Deinococcus frigens]